MAEAFAWAWQKGADVISCSFGHDGRPWILPDVVRAALEDALTLGRGGRGCVVVWAAGNGDEPVSSDEWASHPGTIAVAASTNMDRRAPYSDYGPEIDVCAPSSGGSLSITTTSNGGYTNLFGGTSSAAPLVAGVAALVLSVCPQLENEDVRAILRASADKIDAGGGSYDENGHSRFYGYGRVNAFAAISMISPLIEIVRASDLSGKIDVIEAFANDLLRPSAAGNEILEFLQHARFTILSLIRTDPTIKVRMLEILRVCVQSQESGQHDVLLSDTFLRDVVDLGQIISASNAGSSANA